MMIKRLYLTATLLLIWTPALAEIKIGVAGPMTGLYGPLGKQVLNGAQHAADIFNERDEFQDNPIRVESVDDKCDATVAKDVANQLVGKEVIAIIGHLCDRASINASDVYADNRIVQISPASQNPRFTEDRPLETGGTYRLAARNSQQADTLSTYLLNQPDLKIALLNDGSVYGKGLSTIIETELNEAAITPALIDEFEGGEESYRRLASRLADSGADTIFFGGFYADAAVLIRDLDRLRKKLTIIGGDGLVHADFPRLVLQDNPHRSDLDGILISFPPDPRLLSSAKVIVEQLRRKNIAANGLTLRGFSAVEIIVSALTTSGSIDFDQLNSVLNQDTFNTVLGPIHFDEQGDADITGYIMHKWQEDTIVPLTPLPPSTL